MKLFTILSILACVASALVLIVLSKEANKHIPFKTDENSFDCSDLYFDDDDLFNY